MAGSSRVVIRSFGGSLAEAEGLLAVERATFDESPYTPEQVQALLVDGPQRAWLALSPQTELAPAGGAALAGDTVVGFVIAFLTGGLRGLCWEIDLLAVHPDWRGRGLATRLIRAAAAYGTHLARRTRSAVAMRNGASARAFSRAGFRLQPEVCKLLIYRTGGLASRPTAGQAVLVREAMSMADASPWLAENLRAGAPLAELAPEPAPDTGPADAGGRVGLVLLLAEVAGRPVGYAELLEVQTLLYGGVWIESLVAPARAVREALLHQAVNRAIATGLDEIGAMVRDSDWPLQELLLTGGFRSLGDFRWLTAALPLPGLAAADGAQRHAAR